MIAYRKIIETRAREIRLRPCGDLQKGAKNFRQDLWTRWKEETIKDKDSYVVGMGDYSDSFRPTIQKRLKSAFADDDGSYSELDELVRGSMDSIAKEFEPFKDRIVGLLEGHHYHQFLSGITSTQYLCQKLGTKYLSECAAIQLVVRATKEFAVDIYASHGEGGSSGPLSDIRKHEKMQPSWDVDIQLRGHSTQVYAVPGKPLRKLSSNRGNGELFLTERKRWLINCGGFMDSYIHGESTYVEKAQLPKVALGWAVVGIKTKYSGYGRQGNFEINASVYTP